ncbi:hypothetical protein B0H16DRAFT_1833911 [Mycena metata]|uniref:FAT domain-containing protein n=1 Tax=Mycena metata TaxID=1033252 RepID=A0AAD7IZC3_9AGAR|nr:hypothetical protein B0H16DRAFT_1833911 [Mycena metata]
MPHLECKSPSVAPTPPKFLVIWLGLLRAPSAEGRLPVRQEALATLVPCLTAIDSTEQEFPQWAATARKFLIEEGLAQSLTMYHLIAKHFAAFYPILNVILKWEEQTTQTIAIGVATANNACRLTAKTWLVILSECGDGPEQHITPRFGVVVVVAENGRAKRWERCRVWTSLLFLKALEQNKLTSESFIARAIQWAKVLQAIAAEQEDSWYVATAEASATALVSLFPLPKEDDEQQDDRSDFHTFVRKCRFNSYIYRLQQWCVRLVVIILDIAKLTVAYLADQRRWLLSALVVPVEKSKSPQICNSILDVVRPWPLVKQDTYPTLKEKAILLQKMLICQIYTEPGLRRSDLTARLKQFVDLLYVSVPRSLVSRLTYLLGVKIWELFADHSWIYLALQLLSSTVEMDVPDSRISTNTSIPRPATQSIVQLMQRLLFLDPQAAHDTWFSVFPAAWASLWRRERIDMTQHIINPLSRDYHIKQGRSPSQRHPNLPRWDPRLLTSRDSPTSPCQISRENLCRAAEILGTSLDHIKDDEHTLAEVDVFCGLWRHRCLHLDTNVVLASEQNGVWEQASKAYEVAQTKAEKLQQWDILQELTKSEGNQELMLECASRTTQWVHQKDALEERIDPLPNVPHALPAVQSIEAVQIFASLSTTTALNLEMESSDLKMVLQAWRERLPNLQVDISIWRDFVAWSQGGAPGNTQTFGYRGYHETAWIINRFAHIYTLPNIEISEAFLKLREQARCHYQKPNDLQAGLEVVNDTDLVFFSVAQKAEFYTLKGMFHARFERNEEANNAFSQAVQLDMTQAKAWAEWGRFSQRTPERSVAARQYKSGKSRPLIARIQWLSSVDDSTLAISRAFDTYKGDAAYWFWITFIPHLCMSLSTREVMQARYVLLSLARHYPQALFFQLRTTREEVFSARQQ